tara:strand:+ start:2970 stop:3509 length:540 start_codon:yes stop_codon:yes gene_type:complete
MNPLFLLTLSLLFPLTVAAQSGPDVVAAPVLPVQIVPNGSLSSPEPDEDIKIYEETAIQPPNVAIGAEGEIVVERKVCRYLTAYQQAQDVEFEPGIDVNGRAVVPADINASPFQPADEFEFNVAVDLVEYLGLPVMPGVEAYTGVGKVAVKNNQLYFDDEPLKPESEQALYALCVEEEE